jgi:hypothetical protein
MKRWLVVFKDLVDPQLVDQGSASSGGLFQDAAAL